MSPPLPRISSILEELRGKALFSKFDIRAGYNNIRIRTEDTYKTGFKNQQRTLRMDRNALLALCTAPATFTRMLNEILRPLICKIPWHVPTLHGRLYHYDGNQDKGDYTKKSVTCFFDLLEQHQLFLKPAKNANSSKRRWTISEFVSRKEN